MSATKLVFLNEGKCEFGEMRLKPSYLPKLNDLQNYLDYQEWMVPLAMPGTSRPESGFAWNHLHKAHKAILMSATLHTSAAPVKKKS